VAEQRQDTLSNRLRTQTASFTQAVGMSVHKMGIHPDAITMLGLLLVLVAAGFVAMGQMLTGAVLLLVSLPFDALDGAVARAMQRKGKFGAMLDSTLDRYADGFIFAALSYYFAVHDRFEMLLLAQAALLGAFLVSYTRARAEGLGVNCEIGFFSRMERIVVILLMLFIPLLLDWGVLLLAIGTNITAIQRLWYVYQSLRNEGE
jgi:CDP-diacylglycerol---glycerol-3-phosphate 3-phosphatidyltransferase